MSSSAVVGGPNSMESSMKAARAALMLVPILGVHFVLLPMRPDSGSALEDIYLIHWLIEQYAIGQFGASGSS